MTKITKALVWATVILGFALATSNGLIARETAEPMFLMLPVLAVLSLGNTRDCIRKTKARGQNA